jgi:arsenate reductase
MNEVGIDLSQNYPKNVGRFSDTPFNYVITVCDNAKETCPVFTGKVDKNLHIGFDDPAEAKGLEEEIIAIFRRVRDEIKNKFQEFYKNNVEKV